MLANKKQKESTKNHYKFIDYKQVGLRPNNERMLMGQQIMCKDVLKTSFYQSLNSHCFIPNKSNCTKTKSLKKRMFTFRQCLSL